MSKAELSPADKKAATKLKAIYTSQKNRLGLTQNRLAEHLGITQASVAQYLNGVIPLNLTKVLQFAALLEVDPAEVYPELTKGLNVANVMESTVPIWGAMNGFYIPEAAIKIKGAKMYNHTLAIMVTDNDMAPIFKNGDAVLIDVHPTRQPEPGDAILVKFTDCPRWMPLKLIDMSDSTLTAERLYNDKCMDKYLQFQPKRPKKYPSQWVSNIFKIAGVHKA